MHGVQAQAPCGLGAFTLRNKNPSRVFSLQQVSGSLVIARVFLLIAFLFEAFFPKLRATRSEFESTDTLRKGRDFGICAPASAYLSSPLSLSLILSIFVCMPQQTKRSGSPHRGTLNPRSRCSRVSRRKTLLECSVTLFGERQSKMERFTFS